MIRKITPDSNRVQRDIKIISEFVSSEELGYTRISFSEEDLQARAYLAKIMTKEAGLSVRIDPSGNIIGKRKGKKEQPAILVGSHIDTVRGGGRFDGVSGVIAGLELARRFEEERIQTIHPLEIIVFIAEEPSPFGISTIGSRAMAGEISGDHLTFLKDDHGRTLGMAIDEMGGNSVKIVETRRSSEEILAFLELHIEQGPMLFSRGIPIGVVTGIVGILRGTIDVIGRNDHSGTTSMETRKDALVAGSEAVLALEKVCKGLDRVVGTIGKVEVFPNSQNVIPSRVIFGMEIRSLDESLLIATAAHFRNELELIAAKRGVIINLETKISSKPVNFDSKMLEVIIRVCDCLGYSCLEMPSGAGHDASHLATVAPTGMIFIPSRDGRSHCPEEWTENEHICQGIEVLANTILELDKE